MNPTAKAIAAAVLVAGSLAACADLPFRLPGERAAELKPDQGSILFNADTTGKLPAKRILYSDNEQRVEYVLYNGNGAQAEFVYMERPYNLNVVFNFEYTIADKVSTWNFSRGQPTRWSEAVLIRTKVGDVFYRLYNLTAKNQNCFGVSGEWDRDPRDRHYRHSRIMFGYYCAPAGQALSQEKTLALIDAIGLRGYTERSTDYADTVYNFHREVVANFAGQEASQKAIGLAKQSADSAAGIAEFPFRYAEYFNLGDGPNRDD